MNKVLKDIVNRWRLVNGECILFRPGFDCHGLPIELKALARLRQGSSPADAAAAAATTMAPGDIRAHARASAAAAIEEQVADFRRWGVLAAWPNKARGDAGDIYVTMDAEYEGAQLEVFGAMVSRGLVHRSVKPVYWSPSSSTALAEAELEYVDDHRSKSVYVRFPLHDASGVTHPGLAAALRAFSSNSSSTSSSTSSSSSVTGGVSALVWTTTPWTLPANVALSVNPAMEYCLAQLGREAFIVATARLDELKRVWTASQAPATAAAAQPVILASFGGDALAGVLFRHPLQRAGLQPVPELQRGGAHGVRVSRVLLGPHVTEDSGSGIVHTAPGHGHDDFQVCKEFNKQQQKPEQQLPVLCPVDDHGRFTAAAGSALAGKSVLSDGAAACVQALRAEGSLLHAENYKHRYPYDWRTHQPVIIRTTPQWFVRVDSLLPECEAAVNQLHMVPPVSRNRLAATLGGRTEWCISRQRSWGVPIPAFYRADTGEAVMTPAVIAHVAALFRQHGSDVWWQRSAEELLPPEVRAAAAEETARTGKPVQYRKGADTLDVWFDSGCSWAATWATPAPNTAAGDSASRSSATAAAALSASTPASARAGSLGRVSDLVLEGSDQHRGWFQSSLLTAMAATRAAPYKAIVTHGFVLDEKMRKMSKSLGNVILPADVIGRPPTTTASAAAAAAGSSAAAAQPAPVTQQQQGGKKGGKATPATAAAAESSSGHGVDVLRYWVASSDYTRDCVIGPTVIASISDSLRKVRNTLRFLLGALHGFDPLAAVGDDYSGKPQQQQQQQQQREGGVDELAHRWSAPIQPILLQPHRLPPLDRAMLGRLHAFQREVRDSYDRYSFASVVGAVNAFAAGDLSACYADFVKDRLYADAPVSPATLQALMREPAAPIPRRYVAQAVLWECARALTHSLAPVAPFTAEEVFQHSAAMYWPAQAVEQLAKVQGVPLSDVLFSKYTVFDARWLPVPSAWAEADPSAVASANADANANANAGVSWELLLNVRAAVNQYTEAARHAKLMGSAAEAGVTLSVDAASPLLPALRSLAAAQQLEELTGASHVHLHVQPGDEPPLQYKQQEVLSKEQGKDGRWQVRGVARVAMPSSAVAPAPAAAAALGVTVGPAAGDKCARCWRYQPEVAAHPSKVCNRCDSVLAETGAYSSSNSA